MISMKKYVISIDALLTVFTIQVILQHFYRAGQLEIGESLAAEAGIAEEQGKKAGKEPFMEMNRILEALNNKNLGK